MIRSNGNTPPVFPSKAPSCREGIAVLSCAPQPLIRSCDSVSITGGISDVIDFFYTKILDTSGSDARDAVGLTNPGSPYLDLIFLSGAGVGAPPKVKCFGAVQVTDDLLRETDCGATSGFELPTAAERLGWFIFPLFNPVTGAHEIDMSAVTAEINTADYNSSSKAMTLYSGNSYVYAGGAQLVFAIISTASAVEGALLGRFVG